MRSNINTELSSDSRNSQVLGVNYFDPDLKKLEIKEEEKSKNLLSNNCVISFIIIFFLFSIVHFILFVIFFLCIKIMLEDK